MSDCQSTERKLANPIKLTSKAQVVKLQSTSGVSNTCIVSDHPKKWILTPNR